MGPSGECPSCRARRLASRMSRESASTLVHRSISNPGRALENSQRRLLERSFGRDLSEVRLHTDAPAASAARAVGAKAFTVGKSVAFAANEYRPHEESGQRLLAHELAHVIQQGALRPSGPKHLQRQEDSAAPVDDLEEELSSTERQSGETTDESSTEEWDPSTTQPVQLSPLMGGSLRGSLELEADAAAAAFMAGHPAHVHGRVGNPILARKPAPKKVGPPPICGRPSTRMADYPRTYISDINVDVTSPSHSVTLGWKGPSASSGPTGGFHSSPGAGNCALNCDDSKTSQKSDTHCTPKDGSWPVDYTACDMAPKYPDAKNVTYFQRSGIALHYYPSVPNYPASHGCVRLASLHASQVIHDNSVAGTTMVNVTGTWKRGTDPSTGKPVCY